MSCLIPLGQQLTILGVIPETWKVKPLHQISPSQSVGLVINPSSHYSVTGTVPMLVGSSIFENRIDPASANRISEESNRFIAASRVFEGDLLTVRVGEPGVTAVVPPELDGCNCASVMIVRRHVSFNSHWLSAAMNSQAGLNQVENVQYGTAQKQFNISDAVNFLYAVPPLPEQETIAKALRDTDALIESLEQLLAKKRQIKQGAMQQLLTGQRRLPGFQAKWEEKSLDELFSFSGGHTASRDQLGSRGHCYLHYGDIHTSSRTYIELPGDGAAIPKLDIPLKQVSPNAMLAHGDVVFVDASEDDEGTSRHVVVSNPAAVPFIAGLHTIVAKAKSEELGLLYKRHCFHTESVKAQFRFFAVGTKVSGVSKSNIRKITVLVPSAEEQTAIATTLSDIDAEITALEARLAKTRLLKQGMAQALLTGRIRLV